MSPVGGDQQRYQGMYDPLVAHHARVLDPTKATKIGEQSLDTTVYVTDRILVEAGPNDEDSQACATGCRTGTSMRSPTRPTS